MFFTKFGIFTRVQVTSSLKRSPQNFTNWYISAQYLPGSIDSQWRFLEIKKGTLRVKENVTR